MAHDGFIISDEGRAVTVLNDSGTSAIEAGELLYTAANDDQFSDTVAAVRNSYAAGDIKVKAHAWASASQEDKIVGVALNDIPADGYGAMGMEGIFIHAASENVEAGGALQAFEGTTSTKANKLAALDAGTDSHKIGRALTGGSADGKYIAWKLTL